MNEFLNTFRDALMKWHFVSARDLPWRGEKDPYKIWISEIMLQQTRTETVKGYYARFLKAFQDVFALAKADESEVMKLWEGLGYYSRARNLHAASKKVAFELNGVFPDTLEGLKKLPGVGDYAAGAIASIAFGLREPALDGNQARVLSRVLGITEVIKTPQTLYDRALAIMPETDS
ncbi:MAG: A/G-specific adenine glycosylase, partial [Clostridia bacterium]|nr:A/G-specific adenine glycosylase [Clostridia bacterium]